LGFWTPFLVRIRSGKYGLLASNRMKNQTSRSLGSSPNPTVLLAWGDFRNLEMALIALVLT